MPHRLKTFAQYLNNGQEEIVRRWLERIVSRVNLDRDIIFPSETLLDDVPLLIHGIANFLEGDSDDISVVPAIVDKARELGRLRFNQGVHARQILWEYEILGAIILQYLDEVDVAGVLPERFVRRLMQALGTIQRHTVEEYLLLADEHASAREDRLRSFNRALSHELRNDVGAVLGAAKMLKESFILEDTDKRDTFLNIVLENGERIERLISNLLQLARMDSDPRRNRHVLLRHAVDEVSRRLRRLAEAKGVTIIVDDSIPEVEVSSAGVDLALTNLISNAIKYADYDRDDRVVKVRAKYGEPGFVVVRIADNGTGIPLEERSSLFERFFRSNRHARIEGTGIGLSLVRETISRLGGETWTEFPETGETVFAFSLPARRSTDA